ncbi:MAG: hypothetical protein JKX79_02915 [Labilibaculum sp.]|nr:hypothetical protein [Labilibaculum sp.]
MEKGIIYLIFNWIIEKLKYLNIVHYFKILAVSINGDNRTSTRFAVDIFVILKWLFIYLLWICSIKNEFVNVIVWYLIFTNIYTYFYHHNWSKDLENTVFDLVRIKRRFLFLILSILFNIFSFAYFFALPFSSHIKWSGEISLTNSIYLSISNTLITSYGQAVAITETGDRLFIIQTFISFVFLTIILSNSIPQINTDNNNNNNNNNGL